ncbi:MAG: replication-associated recombination protein A [Actinomycetia bacterium]|nr:replication-associated recombination protein A [Actinomycetes bacterium]
MTLFDKQPSEKGNQDIKPPLAERMRPLTLDGFAGQQHLVGEGKVIKQMLKQDSITSIIFWGPPGSGKTTLARIMANTTHCKFISFSAVTSGIKQIKQVMDQAQYNRDQKGQKTILFVDEIHRFNKAQQDAFLPFIENGTIILVGATTENPSFEINSALLSRCKVFVLKKLEQEEILYLLKKAIDDPANGYGEYDLKIEEDTLKFISDFADGDIRIAYNILEMSFNSAKKEGSKLEISQKMVENVMQSKSLLYDKQGEEHFNLISAVHKSLRGSDPDAATYWITRMLESGEDPLYIIRRLVRFAAEDVGLADTNALSVALWAKQSFEFIGPPEGYLAIIEAAVYLALAPKSNAVYKAYGSAKKDVDRYQALPVPLHIRNAPTKLMKDFGYGKGYKYAHDYEQGIVNQDHLPQKLTGRRYYYPTDRGFEKILQKRVEYIRKIKKKD